MRTQLPSSPAADRRLPSSARSRFRGGDLPMILIHTGEFGRSGRSFIDPQSQAWPLASVPRSPLPQQTTTNTTPARRQGNGKRQSSARKGPRCGTPADASRIRVAFTTQSACFSAPARLQKGHEPPLAVEVEDLEGVLRVHGSLSLGLAAEADGPDCDGPDAVIGLGEK
jgi:hypothetical protein